MNAYRLLVVILLIMIVTLQVRIWSADDGWAALKQLKRQVAALDQQLQRQQQENARLQQKIDAIRHDPQALEALARRDLGMLMPDEQFIRLIILPEPENPLKNPPQPAEK